MPSSRRCGLPPGREATAPRPPARPHVSALTRAAQRARTCLPQRDQLLCRRDDGNGIAAGQHHHRPAPPRQPPAGADEHGGSARVPLLHRSIISQQPLVLRVRCIFRLLNEVRGLQLPLRSWRRPVSAHQGGGSMCTLAHQQPVRGDGCGRGVRLQIYCQLQHQLQRARRARILPAARMSGAGAVAAHTRGLASSVAGSL